MVNAAWPTDLPFEADSGADSVGPGYMPPLMSETEGGPPIMRPRPGPRASEMPWRSVPWSAGEWQKFDHFTREVLRQGTLPFVMPIYRPGEGYVSRICQLKSGTFSTDYAANPLIRVSFTLIVYNW